MDQARRTELRDLYYHTLVDDVVPFWLNHALDREYGGYLNCLDRDGSVYDTDKAIWLQGRGVWLFSTLYNTLEPREEWLEAARIGYEFLARHGYDSDGRMFFLVTRDGRPLIKRRYFFSETFAAIACAQYAKATGDDAAWDLAQRTFRLIVDLVRNPSRLTPKVNPATRRTISHAIPMILLATAQEFRKVDSDPLYDEVAGEAAEQILTKFMRPDKHALFENLNHDGSLMLDTADGLLYFVDYLGKPPTRLEWDQKLWWPHTEALYALLLAHELSGEAWCAEWYERVHAWSFEHFADPEYGEWYGYLHRDGSLLTPLKGGTWKGPFHLPRALLYGYKLLAASG